MNKMLTGLVAVAAAISLTASPVLADKNTRQAGSLTVYGNDEAKFFSPSGIEKAKEELSSTQFDHGLSVWIDTYAELPEKMKSRYTKENEAKFFLEWAKELAETDREKGITILICRNPRYLEVIADKETRNRGFNTGDKGTLRDILLKGFREANGKSESEQLEIRDAALESAIKMIVSDLKGTRVSGATTAKPHANTTKASSAMGGIMGWVCIGIAVLLGVWLVIGIFRALTGGGGGGGGGGMGGGGMGGGGGGGGFLTSLMGGMFGAVAGMWMYNHFMGGGSMFGGSDAYASDNNTSSGDNGGDTGAGDYSGDTGAGGSFDDGSGGGDTGGGGDWGGGGGDAGGGGDWGGGGGDFGGGGGDF